MPPSGYSISETIDFTAALDAVNRASPFNQMAGFSIREASPGKVLLACTANAALLNHAGAMHAGAQAALLDTAAGFAAATIAGNVVTLQLGLTFLASAKGEAFEARATVVKAGKVNLFVEVELYAMRGGDANLVATANAVMAKLGG